MTTEYKQWVMMDRALLMAVTQEFDELTENLVSTIPEAHKIPV
jgi:hypothetical protein